MRLIRATCHPLFTWVRRPMRSVPSSADGVRNTCFPGISGERATAFRQPGGARMRQSPRLLRGALGIRAEDVRPRAGRDRPGDRGLRARLLPPRPGFVRRADGDETVARDAQEPQAPQAARALPAREDQALL